MIGNIHSLESFGTVDGPGIRFVIFLQGCPLRCLYCHNPDTWEYQGGKQMSVEELVNEVLKYKNYIKTGGVTVSGGDPLVQIDFVIELFKAFKEVGIHTCLDTSGYLYSELTQDKYDRLLEVTDLILLDIKHIDEAKHKVLTSQSNKSVLKFAKYLSERNQPVWIRHVLVPGYSDDPVDLKNLRLFIESLHNVEKIEILPYHTMGVVKYRNLMKSYKLEDVQPPTDEVVEMATRIVVKGEIGYEDDALSYRPAFS